MQTTLPTTTWQLSQISKGHQLFFAHAQLAKNDQTNMAAKQLWTPLKHHITKELGIKNPNFCKPNSSLRRQGQNHLCKFLKVTLDGADKL